MIQLKRFPQLNYCVFEAVRYDIITDEKGRDIYAPPVQDKVLYLDRIYKSITFEEVALTNEMKFFMGDILLDKGGLAPTKISMSGTWGYEAVRRGLTIRTGFERFKEFRDELFAKVNSVEDSYPDKTKPNKKRSLYGLNYYDLIHHKFGEVDLKSFLTKSDAAVSPKLQFYDINMFMINALIDVVSKDFLLKLIKGQMAWNQIQPNIWENILEQLPPDLREALETFVGTIADIESTLIFAQEYIRESTLMEGLYSQIIGGNLIANPLSPLTNNLPGLSTFIPLFD